MRAVVRHEYGDTDRVRVDDLVRPEPGPDEVLVRVAAAGLERGTWHLMTGLPYPIRPVLGLRRPKQPVLGREVAGVVEAVGTGVADVAVGEAVVGTADGAFAELAVVPRGRLARQPEGIDAVGAATLPISGVTALQAVRDHGRVAAGHRVLVIGASGGVGSAAVQIAAARGAEVTAVCSGAKADFVRGLGAAHVIDHTREEVDRDGGGYDAILDIAGNRPLRLLRRLLAPGGVVVIVGGEGGGPWLGGMQRQLAAVLLKPFVRQRLAVFVSSENTADLEALGELVARGDVRPTVHATYGFDAAARAIDDLVAGRVCGKAVIVP